MSNKPGRALISVYHKQGIEVVAGKLEKAGWEIISTGGTTRFLEEKGINVTHVSSLTNFPEVLEGRVKTLHPAIFAPILSKRTKEHLEELSSHEMNKIDLVIVNFYPFEEYLEKNDQDLNEMIEKIDIGGPSMVRAASKNFIDCIIVVDSSDYIPVTEKIISNKGLSPEDRKKLAAKAFSYTSFYDSLIAGYLFDGKIIGKKYFSIAGRKFSNLRYGENPHQGSAIYLNDNSSPLKNMEQLNGKALSYNNILDLSMVYEVLNTFNDTKSPFCVIVKHQNPCGAAIGNDSCDAFNEAFSGDPVSSFGGIVGFNCKVDEKTANELKKIFLELIIAPEFSEEALKILKKKKNLRLIKMVPGYIEKYDIKTVQGGFIVQERDNLDSDISEFKAVAGDIKNNGDILFGWRLIKFVKSNAIIIVKNQKLIGVGAGQMSRIDSVELAIKKSNFDLNGSVLISDAFFPFKDSIEKAASHGITTVVEPGGSIRDEEVIEEAKRRGINLIFTGKRHFRH